MIVGEYEHGSVYIRYYVCFNGPGSVLETSVVIYVSLTIQWMNRSLFALTQLVPVIKHNTGDTVVM